MASLFQHILRITNFQSPLLRTIVPSVGAAFAIQAAFAVPSIIAQSDRFYDFSGSVTYLAVTALSLALPTIRSQTTSLFEALRMTVKTPHLFNWRQLILSAAVSIWAARLGSYLYSRIKQEGKDSRFDKIKTSPLRFSIAFTMQALWVSLCLMPVLAVNSLPASKFPSGIRMTDRIGLGLWVFGMAFEVIADRQKAQWTKEKREKKHEEEFLTRGLWSRSRHPNYFGESTLWTGIAVAAAGALGSSGMVGLGRAVGLSVVSPAFVTFLLLRVSGVPLSERKYDERFGEREDYKRWKRETPKFFPKVFG